MTVFWAGLAHAPRRRARARSRPRGFVDDRSPGAPRPTARGRTSPSTCRRARPPRPRASASGARRRRRATPASSSGGGGPAGELARSASRWSSTGSPSSDRAARTSSRGTSPSGASARARARAVVLLARRQDARATRTTSTASTSSSPPAPTVTWRVDLPPARCSRRVSGRVSGRRQAKPSMLGRRRVAASAGGRPDHRVDACPSLDGERRELALDLSRLGKDGGPALDAEETRRRERRSSSKRRRSSWQWNGRSDGRREPRLDDNRRTRWRWDFERRTRDPTRCGAPPARGRTGSGGPVLPRRFYFDFIDEAAETTA